MVVNNPLIRPYFLGGGGIGGVPLDSHDFRECNPWTQEEGEDVISFEQIRAAAEQPRPGGSLVLGSMMNRAVGPGKPTLEMGWNI